MTILPIDLIKDTLRNTVFNDSYHMHQVTLLTPDYNIKVRRNINFDRFCPNINLYYYSKETNLLLFSVDRLDMVDITNTLKTINVTSLTIGE